MKKNERISWRGIGTSIERDFFPQISNAVYRVAALKCRQRKKQWLANLQQKVEIFSQENDNLSQQISTLRDEVVNLKTLLLAHKDCPITQQQGLGGMQMNHLMDYGANQMANPYGMAGMGQQVMAGQGYNMGRRGS